MKKDELFKRLAALGLAICLCLGLSACGSSAEESSTSASKVASSAAAEAETTETEKVHGPVGIFKLVKMEASDISLTEDDITLAESYGQIFYLAFSEDGNVEADLYGDKSTGTWDKSSITLDGSAMTYTLDGDTLTLTEDDTVATLVRSSQEEIDSILENASWDEESNIDINENAGTPDDAGADTTADVAAADVTMSGDYSAEETALFDTDEVSMTITGYDTNDSYYGFVVNVRCENKTSDRTIMFSSSNAAIDGYMVLSFFAEEATAGNSVNGKIEFDRTELEQAGITSVDELTLALNAYDSDTYDDLYKETVTVYPTGKSADEIVYPERAPGDSDVVVADDDNLSFVITGISHDDMWEAYDVAVYIENKTDQNLLFSWDNVAVNGTMLDPYWATELLPGTRAYQQISFYDSELEENGITDITSIEYELTVSDADDWLADSLLDETFTYNP